MIREKYQKECFTERHPKYKGHMKQIGQNYATLRGCDEVIKRVCRNEPERCVD
jgi:hypothetical protein